MESISDSILSVQASGPTVEQQKLLDELNSAVSKTGIKLYINEIALELNDRGPIAVDVEHDEQGNLVGIGYCYKNICEYWTKVPYNTILDGVDFVAHNGVSDFECLRMWGINVKDEQLVHDTMLLGHIMDSSLKSYSLKDMAKRDLGIVYPSYDDIVGTHRKKTKKSPACPKLRSDCCGRITLDKQPTELVSQYNALDCYCTYKLYEQQIKKIY